MNSIHRIQSISIEIPVKNINIYLNYATKLKNRYENYNYSKFGNHDETYHLLFNELMEYEHNNYGKCVVIHGDAVMTNIIINNIGKIKFIDMRGKIGDDLSIYGDFLYDWAKLYQSLIGYDNILNGKNISSVYKSNMIHVFKEYFINFKNDR
jgi:hypothetical protein